MCVCGCLCVLLFVGLCVFVSMCLCVRVFVSVCMCVFVSVRECVDSCAFMLIFIMNPGTPEHSLPDEDLQDI